MISNPLTKRDVQKWGRGKKSSKNSRSSLAVFWMIAWFWMPFTEVAVECVQGDNQQPPKQPPSENQLPVLSS
jgi:hypothetical protein